MARPRGRPIATRGVFALEDPALVLPAAVGLGTSFVVEALIETQPLHVVCAAFLERLVEVDTMRYTAVITSPVGHRGLAVCHSRGTRKRSPYCVWRHWEREDGVAYGTRVFIDFWNFQLNWNERSGGDKIDWTLVPRVLIDEAEKRLEAAGINESLALEETLVYASYNPTTEGKLRAWLESFLNRQPSFNVKVRERRSQPRKIHCAACGTDTERCQCGAPFTWAPEKGVDTAIVTDLLSLAGEDAYQVAILVSSDADHIPAVEWIQAHGRKVINATWAGHGFDLKKTCWADIELDSVMPLLKR